MRGNLYIEYEITRAGVMTKIVIIDLHGGFNAVLFYWFKLF